MAITLRTAAYRKAVYLAFPDARSYGFYNCRKVSNTTHWSQHAWGNAEDVRVDGNEALGNQIYEWTNERWDRFEVAANLWMNNPNLSDATRKAHKTHLHVDFHPHRVGTPGCANGPADIDPDYIDPVEVIMQLDLSDSELEWFVDSLKTSIARGDSPSTDSHVNEWYRLHRSKLGGDGQSQQAVVDLLMARIDTSGGLTDVDAIVDEIIERLKE